MARLLRGGRAPHYLVVRPGIARLPAGVGARELVVLGSVAGVGFTMSLFVAQLAFSEPSLLDAAKLGVVGGSALAALGFSRLLLQRQASV